MNSAILYRALKLCEEVYDESMYGVDDLYRIKDISHSVDSNHWKSKQWLATEFYKHYNHDSGHFYVAGGWYGMAAYQLRQAWKDVDKMAITSADMDPMCEEYAWKLFWDQNLEFITEEVDAEIDLSKYSAIINTSCEHMEQEDLLAIVKNKPKNTWVVFQTNDYVDLNAHINCFKHVQVFAASLNLDYIAYADTLDLGDFKRHMVIGR